MLLAGFIMSKLRATRARSLKLTPRVKVWLEIDGSYAFGLGIGEILQAVDRAGSIKKAASDLGKSYRYVWNRIKEAEEALGLSLVKTQVGGTGSQRSLLTAEARQLVTDFLALRASTMRFVELEFTRRVRPISWPEA
jgi:molybdate transport system regulatory protein